MESKVRATELLNLLNSMRKKDFRAFSSNSANFSVVIENAVGYRCKSLSRRYHVCPLVKKMQKFVEFEEKSQIS